MNLRLICLTALFLAVFAIDTVACGDSLYRVGKGVSYRVYTTANTALWKQAHTISRRLVPPTFRWH
jgi:hypothetical protein